jgi:hypothetical protein
MDDNQAEQFRFWQAPYLSFFSLTFYRDVAQRWRGLSLTYLLVLLAISWLPNILRLNQSLETFRTATLPPLLEQVPKLEIVNGEIVSGD